MAVCTMGGWIFYLNILQALVVATCIIVIKRNIPASCGGAFVIKILFILTKKYTN